jgi:YVTN family beta-propeller protein
MFVCLGDDDTISVIDTKTLKEVGELPSGPDPEQLRVSPDGKLVFVANENDALLTAIDIATRKVVSEFPVGVEPEGVAVSPKDDSIVVNTSETTSMAHLIDWRNKKVVANILVDPRPRYAEYNKDGSELWVTSEVGGTVSVIDPVKHVITQKIAFDVPGLRRSRSSRSAFASAPTASSAFVAIGSRQSRRGHRRGDQAGAEISARRPARLAIGVDAGRQVRLLTTNGVSNDVSVDRCGRAEGDQIDSPSVRFLGASRSRSNDRGCGRRLRAEVPRRPSARSRSRRCRTPTARESRSTR